MEYFLLHKKNQWIILVFFCVMMVGVSATSFAKGAKISDIVVTDNRDCLLVYFAVENCFTPDMNKAIENGITTIFTFIVKLYEIKEWWWDKKIAHVEVKHSIYYDSLRKVYVLRLRERNKGKIEVKDFEQAKKLMSEIVALKITKLRNLRKGSHYQIRMMAELDKIRLPFYLHHILFFLSLWDFETDWYTIDFRY